MIRSDSTWYHHIKKHVYELIILIITISVIIVGFLQWYNYTFNKLQTLANDYHLSSVSHLLKASSELQHFLTYYSGKHIIGKTISKSNHNYSNAILLHIIQTEISNGLQLQKLYQDSRFTALNTKLEYKFATFIENNKIYSSKKDFSNKNISNIQTLLVSISQLVKLHYITYNKLLNEMKTQKSKQNKGLFIITFILILIGSMITFRILKSINKVVLLQEEQDKIMYQQLEMAQMGEMIGNIAHQWRQPLSAISVAASGIKLHQELDLLNKEIINKNMDGIVRNTKFLSETIDTFRDFIKEEKKHEEVILQNVVRRVLDITDASLKNSHIELIDGIDYSKPVVLTTISKELSQVIINIINNAKDIILEKKLEDSWVKIEINETETFAILTIEDNAGGIPNDILPKIFDPYFTTKHKSIGTGLGLHMSRKIIHDSLKGVLHVKNSKNGAKFFIELPLD